MNLEEKLFLDTIASIQSVLREMTSEEFGNVARRCGQFPHDPAEMTDEDHAARRTMWTKYAFIVTVVKQCVMITRFTERKFANMLAKSVDVGCIKVFLDTAYRHTGLKTNGVPENFAAVGDFYQAVVAAAAASGPE